MHSANASTIGMRTCRMGPSGFSSGRSHNPVNSDRRKAQECSKKTKAGLAPEIDRVRRDRLECPGKSTNEAPAKEFSTHGNLSFAKRGSRLAANLSERSPYMR